MEHLIDKLLKDFEGGRMTRRQLIRSLALTASAASVAGSRPANAAVREGGGFKTITVNHISHQVADYKRTRDFYADLLGMKILQDDGTRQCYLAFGDTFIIPRNARQGGTTPRIDHIAYTIDTWNKDAVEAELRRRGLEPRPDTENSFHVKDPDGFGLQISGKEMKALPAADQF
jgi:catechol 2,3-dioxygenase-like lactoylglutathione lyase family enzyme